MKLTKTDIRISDKLCNIVIGGTDTSDYPDFTDAYISYAEHEDGTELTQDELESIPSDVVYYYVIDRLF